MKSRTEKRLTETKNLLKTK